MYRLEFVDEAVEDAHEEREEDTSPGDRDASSVSMSEGDGSRLYFDFDALDRLENNHPMPRIPISSETDAESEEGKIERLERFAE